MRALVLGGTAFLGVHLTNELLARGHEVAHFNRGRTGAAPAGVRTILGDRTEGFAALDGERFDAVIDTSAYVPHEAERSCAFFASRTGRYAFVSTVSVYDHHEPEIFEDSPMPALGEGDSRTAMTPETYGPLKAACEAVVTKAFGQRATIVRPGLIAGPHDPTDRFTYWPVRFARGGRILAPGTPDRAVQFVDARDLARFTAGLLERDAGGDYNVVSPQGVHTMGAVLAACGEVARVPSTIAWVDDERLLELDVTPWTGLPLWVPPSDEHRGFMNHNVGKALAAGFTVRSLPETVRDTLEWARSRPDGYVPRAGLDAKREAEVLAAAGAEP